jgi:hypothetical protein
LGGKSGGKKGAAVTAPWEISFALRRLKKSLASEPVDVQRGGDRSA